MTHQPGLDRRLGTTDAVVVGLSAMLGAGVFVVWGPAAAVAGSGLLVALGIAAVIAFANATSSAQLAEHHPASGGTYLFGREVLGPWWGFLAGWGFVIGKTASCAAMALAFAAYATPAGWSPWAARALAAGAVVVLTALNLRGVTRTALAARVLLVATVAVLLGLLVAVSLAGPARVAPLAPTGGVTGVLQAAGLLFFAFAGYARIATLAEEVRRPQLLGRAILLALGIALVLYVAIGWLLVSVLGSDLPGSTTPLADAARAVRAEWAVPVVRAGAATAALGALLALLAGVGRTTLAMARERDLPATLASVDPRHQVPDHAQLAIGAAVVLVVMAVDLRGAIGFSSFGVLVYYAVTNLAALRQPVGQRRWPRWLQVLGLVGCVVLGATLPWQSVVAGVAVLAVGVAARAFVRR